MELNLKLEFDQVNLILAQAEYRLMEGEMIYYGYRQMLNSIHQQLPEEITKDFHNHFPLLSEVLSIR